MTLRDVAQAANLSVGAVSRFLNRSLVLPPETAARIEAAVSGLGYQPNPHARRLSRGKADMIGLIVPDIANPFFALLADVAERAAAEAGVDLVLCATRNQPERELREVARLGRMADGILFVTNHADDGTLAAAIAASGPAVLLDEDIQGVVAPKVFADNREGGVLAARCLLAAGHRRLAFLGGPRGLLSTEERHAGFRDTVREAGPGAEIVFASFGEYLASEGRIAADRMLGVPCPATAAFASSDETALGVLEAARGRGLSVPRDLSLVAFDDVAPLALMWPPVTAVRQPVASMARRGVQLLLGCVRGGALPPEPLRLTVTLVERASITAPPLITVRPHRAATATGEA